VVLEVGNFGKEIRNTWKVLKDGGGEGWTGSVDQRVKNEEALHRVEERTLLHPIEITNTFIELYRLYTTYK
jgi:hypothetical protein